MSEKTLHASHEAERLAEEVARAMWPKDAASQLLGIRIVAVRPGYARLVMTVRADMVNGHHVCHGGLIFTLADSAFAYACNSYNKNTVASACHIDFLAPAKIGDILEAEAVERSLSGRTGVYDVTVRNRNGKIIALFRGKSYRISGEVIADITAAQGSEERGD
ncbi:MAG: hydroxyphenylacetyl-CoA thioesterase PaaI [Rhodocyclaceae bacterium]|nr:hydroxyphenylacetyl-CoA thioesterase PaaI [Rhodocyclaceae bacterium]